MRVGGGLNYVTGPMGAGKTLFGVRKITAALFAAQYVVTNVELLPGWSDRMARHASPRAWLDAGYRARLAAVYESHYICERDLSEAMRYRPPGTGEARALFMWDETHNDLNNRDWRKDGRAEILRWATQLRKLGFVGFLLSQHADNTDAGLRRVCNFQVRLQNQREQHRVLGMRLRFLPALFLAGWYPAHLVGSGMRVQPYKLERYFLTWHKRLYDSWGLFHGLDESLDEATAPIYLPLGGRQAVARATTPPAGEVVVLSPSPPALTTTPPLTQTGGGVEVAQRSVRAGVHAPSVDNGHDPYSLNGLRRGNAAVPSAALPGRSRVSPRDAYGAR
jgi:hypothetical protein